MKKKILSLAAVPVLALFGTLAAMPVSADETASADVTVTVADTGTLKVVNEPLTVTDTDGDGALTVNDVLYLIHEAKFEGGAAAGYATAETQWGLGITKLWGNENGGSFGYTVNNAFANGLTDTVKAGDAIYAYTYKDAAGYSDVYSYFDTASVETETGKAFTLTLKSLVYGESGMTEQPVADAAITVNGTLTNYMTENNGTVAITMPEPGDYVISAVKENATLVPPAVTVKVTGEGEAPSVGVNVTVSNAGKLVVVQEPLTVTDTDSDGKLTVSDALYLIHEAKFEGGAAAGYATAETQWGLSIAKLWGNENGGSYGITVNNVFSNGIADEITEGNEIYAYAYEDAAGYSDIYTYFDNAYIGAETGKAFTLTLTANTFDENWSPVQKPVEGAVITLNGEKTAFVTDAEGKVQITVDAPGAVLISAVSEQAVIVPPVATANVTEAQQQPGQTDEPGQTDTPGNTGNQGGTQNVPAVQAGERAPIAVCVTALAMLGAAAFVRRKHEN